MIAGLMGLATEANAEDKFYLPDFEIWRIAQIAG